MRNYFSRTGNKGFTMTELLTIILIIAALATLMFPHFKRSLANAKVSDCMNNQRQFATMIQVYYIEWKLFPDPDANGSLSNLLPYNKLTPEYTAAKNKLFCPDSKELYVYQPNPKRDNFTISCRSGHPLLGLSPLKPYYTYAGGLFKGED
ncbi:MAG: type II secretion system protein [Candidatus Eremiobacterota bacterium]